MPFWCLIYKMIPFLYDSAYISIQTVWIFAILALLTGSYLAVERLKRSRVNFTLFIEHSSFLFLNAIIASRIVYFFLHPDTYLPGFNLRTVINFFSVWDQGFSFWGALIGFTAALLYRLHRSEENKWKWLDALVVPLIIGMMIGAIGNFLGGYAYGNPTELPWGVRYEVYNVKYTVPVHPVQLYQFLFLGLILVAKNKLNKKTAFFQTPGNSTIFYMWILSLGLFILEFFRGDDTLLIFSIRWPMILFAMSMLLSSAKLLQVYQKFKHPSHEPEST